MRKSYYERDLCTFAQQRVLTEFDDRRICYAMRILGILYVHLAILQLDREDIRSGGGRRALPLRREIRSMSFVRTR